MALIASMIRNRADRGVAKRRMQPSHRVSRCRTLGGRVMFGNRQYSSLEVANNVQTYWVVSYICQTDMLMGSCCFPCHGAGICALRECINGRPYWQHSAECCDRPFLSIHAWSVVIPRN